jgi:dolichyl-phosphate mannosyltransferase polypeptide 2 regulatory subunit
MQKTNKTQLDRLVGLTMLIAATTVFVYYTIWTLFMVLAFPCLPFSLTIPPLRVRGLPHHQPFVDDNHFLHSFFLPRVWAIRIPVLLIILGSTVVGSFLSVVMIRSNRKKALKAKGKKAS